MVRVVLTVSVAVPHLRWARGPSPDQRHLVSAYSSVDRDPTSHYRVLAPDDHFELGEAQFGNPGLGAIESIGPFVPIKASGPLLTVHDSTIDAGLGIGHHPHQGNERLFYIEEGQLDHDDALNHIKGHMDTGDVGQFTEGRRGMIHSEWNNGEVDARAFILVYATDPMPSTASFGLLSDAEAPRYEPSPGVLTKELVGQRSPLVVNGDVRLFTDDGLAAKAAVTLSLAPDEGGVVSVRSGEVELEGQPLVPGTTVVVPPADTPRALVLTAVQASRIIRVGHGPGQGFVLES